MPSAAYSTRRYPSRNIREFTINCPLCPQVMSKWNWPQQLDDRLAWRRKIDAGGAAALDPTAVVAGRAARSLDDRLGRRQSRRRRADQPAAVSLAASFGEHRGADRRRNPRQARRDLAGAQRRAVPRRISG